MFTLSSFLSTLFTVEFEILLVAVSKCNNWYTFTHREHAYGQNSFHIVMIIYWQQTHYCRSKIFWCKRCLTEPVQWQRSWFSLDSILFWSQPSLQFMISCVSFPIGKEGFVFSCFFYNYNTYSSPCRWIIYCLYKKMLLLAASLLCCSKRSSSWHVLYEWITLNSSPQENVIYPLFSVISMVFQPKIPGFCSVINTLRWILKEYALYFFF